MGMTRSRHRLHGLPRSRILLVVTAALLVIFLAGSVLWAQRGQQQAQDLTGVVAQERDTAATQRDATAARAASLAEQIKAACREGTLQGPVCEQAEEVAASPVPPVPGPIGPAGPPPTAEEISAAVQAYLAANPPPAGRPPTTAEVASAVAGYLSANPPTPGRPPTGAEIFAAVQVWYEANPPAPGEDGDDGAPGRPPTAAEIQAAVNAWMAAHPPAAGPKGDPGPAGKDGADGAVGPPGKPPSSYRLAIEGTTYLCTRVGTDDAAPNYTCAPVTDPTDEGEGVVTDPP